MRTKHTISIRRGGTLICLTALWLTFAGVASAAPNILFVDPTSGANTAPVDMTITGTGFVSGATARLERSGQDSILGTDATTSPLQMSATFDITAAAPGAWNVRVTNPDTTSDVCTACFTVTASAPTVTGASPSSRGQGATAQNITITGTNFAHGAQASFSGTGITVNSTTFVSTTQLTANITVSPTATVGARNVTVTNTDNQYGSCSGCFTVNVAPVVTSVAPPALPNTASAQLTFTGTGFVTGIAVQLELAGQPAIPGTAVVVVNATTMTATFDITDVAPGDWNVHVTNADAGTSVCTECFTITASDPEVTSASPASRGQGATDQDIAIIGSDFAMGASVSFSGTGITVNDVTFVDGEELTANITISPTATTGLRNITVTNTDGQSGLCTGCFTVNTGPTVTGAVPSSRGQGATSQSITVSGTDFVEGAIVSFSGTGITVNSTTFVDSEELTANITISPTATTGARDVIVTNPDAGTDACTGCFTVNTGPTVTGTDPSSLGRGAIAEEVTVTGTGFVNGATVSFSGTGVNVTNTAFVDATELTVTVTIEANAATGLRDVTVTNPDGGKKTCVGCFTVNAAPTVTDVTPDNLGQGAAIRI